MLSLETDAGYCPLGSVTINHQLTDVEQEIKGLLTADRKPKADLEQLNRIITHTP